MKKVIIFFTTLLVLLMLPSVVYGVRREIISRAREGHMSAAEVQTGDKILNGVFLGPIDVSGKTAAEASAAVESYFDELKAKRISVKIGHAMEKLTIADTGFSWGNPDAAEQAMNVGKSGNIIERYKHIHDIETGTVQIPLTRQIDDSAVSSFVSAMSEKYSKEPVRAKITMKEYGEFEITKETEGLAVDEESSAGIIADYLVNEWNGEETVLELDTEVLEPSRKREDLLKIKDVLGRAATEYTGALEARAKNVENGTQLLDGIVLYPGDTLSVEEWLTPFTEENGYDAAPSYNSGRTEDSLGGGICQVSSTLYCAALKAEMVIEMRFNHSMIVHYVDPAMDATIAENSKDLMFYNPYDDPVYIHGYCEDGWVYFEIWGNETRPAGYEVKLESETLSVEEPGFKIIADEKHGIGHVEEMAPMEGIEARLWKIVYLNGVEQSREIVNESKYDLRDDTLVVGVVSDKPAATEAMYRAIATNDVDEVYSVMDRYGTYSYGEEENAE